MAIISNTITTTSGYAVTATSLDPIVDVTVTGGVLAIGDYGIVAETEATAYSVDFNIDGVVSTTASAVWFKDNGGTVTVGETGVLRSDWDFGIVSWASSLGEQTIVNAGQILGDTAISTGNAADVIQNTGIIRAFAADAIRTYGAADKVVNAGAIYGNVMLGAGDDKFVAKAGGSVDGTINGGYGNDRYWIVDNSLTLADDDGIDKILSRVSHTLGADFENLTLLGTKDRNGIGNASANVIVGNSGDNKLRGYAGNDHLKGSKGADRLLGGDGADILEGGRGRDVLIGGSGYDDFVFSTNNGRDKILDFNPNASAEDIDLSGMASITGYSDLVNNHMVQDGADVLIDGGGGDVLKLVGIDIGDLDATDFLF